MVVYNGISITRWGSLGMIISRTLPINLTSIRTEPSVAVWIEDRNVFVVHRSIRLTQ